MDQGHHDSSQEYRQYLTVKRFIPQKQQQQNTNEISRYLKAVHVLKPVGQYYVCMIKYILRLLSTKEDYEIK